MSDVVIRAEGLGKKYIIGHAAARERYGTLRDAIAQRARNMVRSTVNLVHGRPNVPGDEFEAFWALRDVNFEVRRGDVIGIIGRNGAGKSTLLKILSRITEPTEGRVTIRGRVASLLEVGTGFHPELTGRENVFLNGAILGMTRAEIKRRFDEIVDFAGVERFLDTPVKRFSSGMYVRLAFAVAAHLEPEILIVDEVLAVGDTEFQRKCIGKMADVTNLGRTIIFVSHNLAAVEALCKHSLLLKAGRLEMTGGTTDVIQHYLSAARSSGDERGVLNDVPSELSLLQVEMLGPAGALVESVRSGEAMSFRLRFRNDSDVDLRDVNVAIGVKNPFGQVITMLESFFEGQVLTFESGETLIEFAWPRCPLSAGVYSLSVWVATRKLIICQATDVLSASVEAGDFYGTGAAPPSHINCVFSHFRVTAQSVADKVEA